MQKANTMFHNIRSGWSIPAALIALSLIPIVTSAMRTIEIGGNPLPTPDNARFLLQPFVIYIHAIGGSVYLLLGALQFSAPLRQKFPKYHRRAGRLAVLAGTMAALSGMWMTETFPAEPANPSVFYGFRMIFGSLWLVCLACGLLSALHRNFKSHRKWMMRAYAIGIGGGTSVLTVGGLYLVTGDISPKSSALAQTAAWAINLMVVEYVLRRQTLSVEISRA